MPLVESGSKEALSENIGKEIATGENKDEEYQPMAISCLPESVSASDINLRNRNYWEGKAG